MRKISDNQKLIEKYKKKYWGTKKRQEKGRILTELEEIAGLDHKHITRELLRSENLASKQKQYDVKRQLKRRGKYDEIIDKLKELWEMGNYESGKRLVGSIPSLLDALARFINWSEREKQLLLLISPATIDRRLQKIKKVTKLRYRNPPGTTRGDLLKSQIPIRTHRDWVEKIPGYLEIDTVHHCSGNLSGTYALTLDVVDVYSGWNECQAMLGKNSLQVRQSLSIIKQKQVTSLQN
jgi:hypothetical protein